MELQLFFVVFSLWFLVELFIRTQLPGLCGLGFYTGISSVGFLILAPLWDFFPVYWEVGFAFDFLLHERLSRLLAPNRKNRFTRLAA